MKLFTKNTLNPFDWFLILGITGMNVIYSLMMGEWDAVGSLAGISGVACVVLVAKRNIANYLFGVVNVSLYAYISYKAQIYGDAVLNAFYYLPMQFVGWYSWIRRKGDTDASGRLDETVVKARRMTGKQRLYLLAFCIITVSMTGYLLSVWTADPQPYKDAATTVLSIIAMFLMVRMFMEQWALWVIVNTISVIMWIIASLRGDAHAELMVIMWIFYLANSLNGLRIWNRSSKEPERAA